MSLVCFQRAPKITANLWPLTAHIYHVMIIVTDGFSKTSFYHLYTFFFDKNTFCKNIEAQTGQKNKNKLRTKWSSDYVQYEIKIYIAKGARCSLKMFNNGAQFVGLTPRPIKSKIIFSIRALHLWWTIDLYLGKFLKISFFPSEMEISGLFNKPLVK